MTPMRNLGPVSQRRLASIGVTDLAEIRRRGAVPIYLELLASGQAVSRNLLWALQGAILDCDWRDLSPAQRQQLINQLPD